MQPAHEPIAPHICIGAGEVRNLSVPRSPQSEVSLISGAMRPKDRRMRRGMFWRPDNSARRGKHRTHSEVLSAYLGAMPHQDRPVIVEVGLGLTSAVLAAHARKHAGRYYACDLNAELVEELRRSLETDEFVQFMVGKSDESLQRIVAENPRIDFVFLDGAPSAMMTFREFRILESALHPGAILVLDNAAIPGESAQLRSPCRKGKIVVPYLLASSFWEVIGHPEDGDSMVAAIRHSEGTFADKAYEDVDGTVTHDVDLGWRRRIPK